MNGLINAYIKKGGAGTWLELPSDKNCFQKAISGIEAADPADMTIGQYETDIAAIPAELLMTADLNQVNYLAARLVGMDCNQLDELDAIMQTPFQFTTVEQLIDYTYNSDYFLFRPGINDVAELGRYYVFDTGLCQMPEEWKGGIELERFGAHAVRQERGIFTSKGYLMPSGDEWHNWLVEHGIPDEYRLYQQGK